MLRIGPQIVVLFRGRGRGPFQEPFTRLRNIEFPEGIPEVLDSLPVSKRRKLDLDTRMADLAAESCISAHCEGRHSSLEHPRNSLARGLASWQKLERMSGYKPRVTMHVCFTLANVESLKF